MKKTPNELYHTTAVYRGKSYVTRECITGKLSFFVKGGQTVARDATIAVLTPSTEAAFLATNDASSTVAAVFIGERPSDALCTYAGKHELPLLILGKLSPEHNGKIAILDSRTATLFVDPDLETLERYARHLRLSADYRLLTLSPTLCACHCAVPLTKACPSALFANGRMLPATDNERISATEDEEALFEALRDLAENAVGVPMLLPIRVYELQTEQGISSLQTRLRALLRAAVYGSFSLLFEGLYSAEAAKTAFAILDRVICELAAEGREHDRQLPRGIAVESLLLLHEMESCPPLDYVCLDWDRLLRTALPPFAGKTPPIEAKHAFLQMLNGYTQRIQAPICARTVHAPMIHGWRCEDTVASGICTLFVPEAHLGAWCEWRDNCDEKGKASPAEKN